MRNKNIIKFELLVVFLMSVPVFTFARENADAVSCPDAQDDKNIKDKGVKKLVAPKLLKYVEAVYPEKAFNSQKEAIVKTKIHLNEKGQVTKVEILEPAGQGFDRAAADAIKDFEFEPAMYGCEPVKSQVIYNYRFFIKQKAEIKVEAPVRQILSGKVKDLYKNPVEGAIISYRLLSLKKGSDEKSESVAASFTTREDGVFSFEDFEAGKYEIIITASGYENLTITEELVPGEKKDVLYHLELKVTQYETVVRDRRPPREVTRREITRREITKIPGTGGDALRSIQNLPGMARAPGISGMLLVRGSAPGDSKYYFDSLSVPALYHFGGLTSIINSDLLERIDFYPGNYSVRYGGATGGIIDAETRTLETDRFHAYIDADIWDIGGLVMTPINDDWSIAVAGRRSYIDLILNAVLPEDSGLNFTVAPRYYDYQLIADYHPSEDNNLRLFLFGTDDNLVMVLGEEASSNPNFAGNIDFRVSFHQFQANWKYRLSDMVTNNADFGFGYQYSESKIGEDMSFSTRAVPFFIRDELTFNSGGSLTLRVGTDTILGWAKWRGVAPEKLPMEGEPLDPLGAEEKFIEIKGETFFTQPAIYTEVELDAIKKLTVIGGLRVDYFGQVKKVGIDPRLVLRYSLFNGTTLKGGVGIFHQAPGNAEGDDDYGNPDLDLTHAVHYGVGAEQELGRNVELSVEGFYKDLKNLVVSSDATITRDGKIVPERFSNEGEGEVYGLEFLLKHKPTDRFFGWIAYTLMKSKRIDHPGDEERLFDFDQTHILTIVASVVLGRGWEAGIRFRLVSGNPLTPVTNSVYDGDSDIYWPVYGRVNSTRMPAFHQLDVRIDKKWQFKHLSLNFYVDVQNVYNKQNVEGYMYNYDYSEKQFFYGLPILPSFGLKIEY